MNRRRYHAAGSSMRFLHEAILREILPLMQDFMGVADPASPVTKDPTARKLQLLKLYSAVHTRAAT